MTELPKIEIPWDKNGADPIADLLRFNEWKMAKYGRPLSIVHCGSQVFARFAGDEKVKANSPRTKGHRNYDIWQTPKSENGGFRVRFAALPRLEWVVDDSGIVPADSIRFFPFAADEINPEVITIRVLFGRGD